MKSQRNARPENAPLARSRDGFDGDDRAHAFRDERPPPRRRRADERTRLSRQAAPAAIPGAIPGRRRSRGHTRNPTRMIASQPSAAVPGPTRRRVARSAPRRGSRPTPADRRARAIEICDSTSRQRRTSPTKPGSSSDRAIHGKGPRARGRLEPRSRRSASRAEEAEPACQCGRMGGAVQEIADASRTDGASQGANTANSVSATERDRPWITPLRFA